LIEIAKTETGTIHELEVELTSRQIQNWGSLILEAVQRGAQKSSRETVAARASEGCV